MPAAPQFNKPSKTINEQIVQWRDLIAESLVAKCDYAFADEQIECINGELITAIV